MAMIETLEAENAPQVPPEIVRLRFVFSSARVPATASCPLFQWYVIILVTCAALATVNVDGAVVLLRRLEHSGPARGPLLRRSG